MNISQTGLIFVILLATVTAGVVRGWGREVITCAMVLGTLLFLEVGGDRLVANLLLGGGATTSGGSSAALTCYGSSYTNTTRTLSGLIFGGMTLLGYYAGRWHGSGPVTGNHRIAGGLLGLVTGGAITFYISRHLFPGGSIVVQMPDSSTPFTSLALILLVGLVGLVGTLFVARQNKRSSKAH